jgi:pimeloyl-ACP methyl ester carboxylesterase
MSSLVKVERGDVTLVVDDTGGRDLPPVVLLHGLSSARSTWRRLTRELDGRYRVVAFDDRGHGESSHAPGTYSLANYTADAIGVLEEVVGQPSVLVGHSLGGVIAACVARQRADLVRGVVLEDPPLFVGARDADDASPMLTMFGAMRQVLGEMQSRGAALDEYETLVRAAPAMSGKGTMADALGEDGTNAQARAMAGLDPEIFTPVLDGVGLIGADPEVPLGCPTLVLRADPSLGAALTADDEARFLTTNPGAVVTVVDGASHLIHDDEPERFLAEVTGFLDRLAAL